MTGERSLEATLGQLPDAPGVYLMLGAGERILYIGKAVSLRNRVRSYFQDSAAHALRTQHMVERVVDVRWIVVNNEIEALILEANLIKRHQPPFNVRLRDDKRYPYLKVTNEPFPRVMFTRVVRDDGARYFGPYTNAHGIARADQHRAGRLPAAHLPRTDRRQAQASVPAVSHQALPGAVRRLSERERIRRAGRRSRALSRRAARPSARALAARDERRRRADELRGRGAHSRPDRRRAARDREPEGRLALAHRHGSDRGRARRRVKPACKSSSYAAAS